MPFLNLLVSAAILFFIVRTVANDRDLSWWWCVMWVVIMAGISMAGFFLLGPNGFGLPEDAAFVAAKVLGLVALLGILLYQGYGWRNVGIMVGVLFAVQAVFSALRLIARTTG